MQSRAEAEHASSGKMTHYSREESSSGQWACARGAEGALYCIVLYSLTKFTRCYGCASELRLHHKGFDRSATRKTVYSSRVLWLSTCPRRWLMSITASRSDFARRHPDHGCSGRTARAQTRITGRASSCCASSALTVSVGEGQVTLGIQCLRARAFCYRTFAHTLSIAYEGHARRIL